MSRQFVSWMIVLVIFGTGNPLLAADEGPAPIRMGNGLKANVEVIRDHWGIHHIYAQNEEDLFFAQGYLAAKDRLFQFEVWRRRATGTVAEILGRREIDRDIGARLLRSRSDLTQELNHYHPRGKIIVDAFVAGVNAQVEEALADPSSLPIEFQLLGIVPGKWTPEVVISRHQALTANVVNEVAYTRILASMNHDEAKLKEILWLQGGAPSLKLDPAIDSKNFPPDVLRRYNAYRDPIEFQRDDILPRFQAAQVSSSPFSSPKSDLPLHHLDFGIGSNNWIVGGERSLSRLPILANDPHRVITVPSLRYWVHLHAPGWNVIGGGEPTLPGVSIGHNEHGAWGLTIFGTDTEDLYVYETNPLDPDEYRYRNGWERMTTIAETITVKGESDLPIELKFTRHGPVIFEDKAQRKAYALRAAWLETGASPYFASLRINQAASWDDFRDACAFHRMPSLNMIWADRSGTMGWQVSAIAPLRSWSGLLPVPGDGRYEWEGYLPVQALPHEKNPERGYLVTANHYLYPNEYPHPQARHYVWADPYRAARIHEVLDSGRRFSVADMVQLQNDDFSIPARSLIPLLRGLSFDDPWIEETRKRLLGWDFVLDKDSAEAAIYELFLRRLSTAMHRLLVPEGARKLVPESMLSLKRNIDRIYSPDGLFGDRPIQARDQMLKEALEAAVGDAMGLFGPDQKTWRWGDEKLHHVRLKHPLSRWVRADIQGKLDFATLPRGGDASTITATSGKDQQETGGSFKIIVDLENWENSVGINTPGQSGNPEDPHYRDLYELWAEGKYFPVAFDRERVESVAESRFTLSARPETRGDSR